MFAATGSSENLTNPTFLNQLKIQEPITDTFHPLFDVKFKYFLDIHVHE